MAKSIYRMCEYNFNMRYFYYGIEPSTAPPSLNLKFAVNTGWDKMG